MKRSAIMFFLALSIAKPDINILDKKLPVVIAVSSCPQKTAIENALQVELQKRQISVITSEATAELFSDQLRRVQANTSQKTISQITPTKEGMLAYLENQYNQVSNIAQKLYVTTVLNANMELDSCYYSIRALPEPLPQSKRKVADLKICIPDSVIKKNDINLLAFNIVELCTRKKDAKK